MNFHRGQGYEMVNQGTFYPAVEYPNMVVDMHHRNFANQTQVAPGGPKTIMRASTENRDRKLSPNVGPSLPNILLGVFIFFTAVAMVIMAVYRHNSEYATISEMTSINSSLLNLTLSYIWTVVANLTIAIGLASYFGIPLSCGENPNPLILSPERCVRIWLTAVFSFASGLIFSGLILSSIYVEVLKRFINDRTSSFSDANAVEVYVNFFFLAAGLVSAGNACFWFGVALYFFYRKSEEGIVAVRNIWVGIVFSISGVLTLVAAVMLGLTELDLENPVEHLNLMMQTGPIPCLYSLTIVPPVLGFALYCIAEG